MATRPRAPSSGYSAHGDPDLDPDPDPDPDLRAPSPAPAPAARSRPAPAPPAPTLAQAIHDFDPSLLASTSADNTQLYLSFKVGEIIRVHVQDPTGWWDGEITGVGVGAVGAAAGEDVTVRAVRRGWFPSNYVKAVVRESRHRRGDESTSNPGGSAASAASGTSSRAYRDAYPYPHHRPSYSHASHVSRTSTATTAASVSRPSSPSPSPSPSPGHPRAHPRAAPAPPSPTATPLQALVQPIHHALSLLDAALASRRTSHIQPSTAYAISSIRAALAQTGCLSKDSRVLVRWPVLAKERKIVLVELSRLVQCARAASGTSAAGAAGTAGAAGAAGAAGDGPAEERDEAAELEALAKAARGVFASARRFLALAEECGVEVVGGEAEGAAGGGGEPGSVSGARSVAAPHSYWSSTASSTATTATTATPTQTTVSTADLSRTRGNTRLQEAFRLKAARSAGDLRAARQMAGRRSPPPSVPSLPSASSSGSASTAASGAGAEGAAYGAAPSASYSGYSSNANARTHPHGRTHSRGQSQSRSQSIQGHARTPSSAGAGPGALTPMSATFSTASSDASVSSPVSARFWHERRMLGSMDSVYSAFGGAGAVGGLGGAGGAGGREEGPGGSGGWEADADGAVAAAAPGASGVYTFTPGSATETARAISLAEDALLSIIAAFIGHIHSHHIGSHPSSHAQLIEMTRETIDTVRELLTIVEGTGQAAAVRRKRPREVEALRVAKDVLYEVASRLVESAEVVAHAPFADAVIGGGAAAIGEEGYDKEKARLLHCATATLRAGTECVRLVKLCVPEDEPPVLPVITTTPSSSAAAPTSTPRPAAAAAAADGRQATPRPGATAGAGPGGVGSAGHLVPGAREKGVGVRGVHTLSGLHRKATSLDHLQRIWSDDTGGPGASGGAGVVGTGEEGEAGRYEEGTGGEEEAGEGEEEEVMRDDLGRDEDSTLRHTGFGGSTVFPERLQPPSEVHQTPRRPSNEFIRTVSDSGPLPLSAHAHSQLSQHGTLSQGQRQPPPAPSPRNRASSLTSPAPPRMQHRSPSRSADLDKFTADYDYGLQRAGRGERAGSVSSRASGYTSAASFASGASGVSSASSSSQSENLRGEFRTPLGTRPLAREGSTERAAPYSLRVEIPAESQARAKMSELTLSGVQEGQRPRPYPPGRSNTTPLPSFDGDIPFWVVKHDYDPREISFNSDGNIIGASLNVLVEKMTPHDGLVDHAFSATFFYTFRLFTTPAKLLEAVVERYHLQPPKTASLTDNERALWMEHKILPIRLRVYNFLKIWLDQHWRAETDDTVLEAMTAFTRDDMVPTLPAMGPRLLLVIQRRMDAPLSAAGSDRPTLKHSASSERLRVTSAGGAMAMGMSQLHPPTFSASSLPPTPQITKSLLNMLPRAGASVNVTEFDTVELARQLTIVVSKMFCAVEPEDLLLTGKKTIPELRALSTHSNQVTGWVADSILNEGDAKKRASLLKFFIKLADKCLALSNFFTMWAVLAGLNSSTISRLHKTWDALSTKYRILIERLRAVIEHTRNHHVYRAKLRDAPSPCLPFLGLILTDITFLNDGNPNTRPSNLAADVSLINFDKYVKLGKIASEFRRYQEPFNFHELESVQDYLRKVLTERGSGSVDALYRKSLMLEPRQGSEKLRSNVERPGWLSGRI